MISSKIPVAELSFNKLRKSYKDLVDKLNRSAVIRRDAMKLAIVTGVSLTVAEQLLTEGKAVQAASPIKGGTMRFVSNLYGPDDQLDSPQFTSSVDHARGRATYI